ncbi:MAG TPA: metallophosphoesterase [Eubacteriaceae bacterium]|nr:metallophosphoesterase [Eubacteriaceae bacterium]
MRIGIVSDTHGNIPILNRVVEQMGEIDLYIHLGDFVTDGKNVFSQLKAKNIIVKGNCDLLEETDEEIIVEINNKKFLITHGHKYNIKYGYNNIYYRALEEETDVVLFGHTHMPLLLWYKEILFFNPGSTAYPKGGNEASYGIIEIVDGEIYPEIFEIKSE